MATKIEMPASGEFDAGNPGPGAEVVPEWATTPAREAARGAGSEAASEDASEMAEVWGEEGVEPEKPDLSRKLDEAIRQAEADAKEYEEGWGLSPDPVAPGEPEKPAEPETFGKAFAAARAAGLADFTWRGKRYTTKTRAEAKTAEPKARPSKAAAPAVEVAAPASDAAPPAADKPAAAVDKAPDVGTKVVGRRAPDRPISTLAKADPGERSRVLKVGSTADALADIDPKTLQPIRR